MRRTGDAGRSIIKRWEGLRLVAYKCPAGKPTIGYGHTGADVKESDVGRKRITKDEAERLFDNDLLHSERYVHTVTGGKDIGEHRFDALVSMAYNLGSFGTSLKTFIRSEKWEQVARCMKRYVHASPGSEPCRGRCGNPYCTHRIEPGLITRRAEEARLLLTGKV